MRNLINQHINANQYQEILTTMIYALIVGLFRRFLVEGYDKQVETDIKNSINTLFEKLVLSKTVGSLKERDNKVHVLNVNRP